MKDSNLDRDHHYGAKSQVCVSSPSSSIASMNMLFKFENSAYITIIGGVHSLGIVYDFTSRTGWGRRSPNDNQHTLIGL